MERHGESSYRGIAPRLVTVALLVAATGCNGKTIQASNSNNQTVPACGGCVYTKADNPVLSGSAQVAVDNEQGQSLPEEALRNDDQAWRFSHFQLTLSVTGGNTSKGSIPESHDYAGPVPWPAQQGDWVPSGGNPVTFPWEAHGIRVGYANLTVNAQKQESYRTTVPILGTVLRLDPKTILVPIQVAQLVPDYAGAPWPTITKPFDKAGNNVIFDDRWGVAIQKESTPGGIFDHITGAFGPKADDSSLPHEYSGMALPDDVFRQCGIQFRMVKFVKVKVPRAIWEMIGPDGNTLCGGQWQRARMDDAYELAIDAGLDSSLPVVMYTLEVASGSCQNEPVGVACGYGYCSHYYGAVQMVAPLDTLPSPYVLSHEIGHILGLDDLDKYAAECTDGVAGPLMCPYVSEIGPGFTTNDVRGSCATAREGAAAFSKTSYGSSPSP